MMDWRNLRSRWPACLTGVLVLWLVLGTAVQAQDPAFGKNKVIWKKFDWSYISTRHYDVYFYDENYELAKFAAEVLEEATPQIERELNYKLRDKVPVLVYDSHNDFQQTNIGGGLIPEGVGGFTESFKNRVVLPFDGSYENFRHVLHHELTHAFTFDMLYGGGIGSFISAGTLFQLPLWFAEGYAEYSSRHGMDYFGDMVLRDAVINNYLIPLSYAGGFIVYKEGQSAIQYIADQFGEEKIAELLQRSRALLSMDKGVKAALGLSMKDFDREWSRALKREYWPEIARRLDPRELGKPLTRHEDQGSNFNEKPAFSPRGDRVAIFSDRSDFTEVYIISAVDGKVLRRLVKGERSGDFESLHSYVSGLSWSPDGERITLAGKSKGRDALIVVDADDGDVELHAHLGVTSLLNPAWGPRDRIAYMGMVDGQADLYVYDLQTEEVQRLTHDFYDDNEPTWSPDGRYIVFASDRPVDGSVESDVSEFTYGAYHLFRYDMQSGEITPLTTGAGNDRAPAYSPDGERIAYVSDRNGIANIYVMRLETGEHLPVTDILTGAASPSWSPEGDKLVFSSFNNGGFDVFLMDEIQPRGENGVLALTPLAERLQGKTPANDATPPVAGEEPTSLALVDTDVTEAGAPEGVEDSVRTGTPSTDSTAPATAEAAADDSTGSLTPPGRSGHFGSLRFRSESDDDSTNAALRRMRLSRDSTLILDPVTDSVRLAERVEEAKREGQGEDGEYEVKDYKVRFSPDVVAGALGYSSFYGLQGQSYLLVSDYMNNHQFFLASDVINTFDDANVLFFYNNAARRMQWGAGLFHTKYFYIDEDLRLVGTNNGQAIVDRGRLFSDRFYGGVGQIRYPLSLFTRLELSLSHVYVDREYYDRDTLGRFADTTIQATIGSVSWVRDNTLWGMTGPVNGGRANVTVEYALSFNNRSVDYAAINADWRRYLKLGGGFTMAARFAGGYSGGSTPKQFYLGGVSNWIGSDLERQEEIYRPQSLYFSQISFPLRGYNYYSERGTRYSLANFELRYPFIDYLAMRFPLGLRLARVQGAFFVDAGMAWDDESPLIMTSSERHFHLQDLKVGYGFGMRANLGFLLLRWDIAWPTDLNIFARRAHHYVSMGADF